MLLETNTGGLGPNLDNVLEVEDACVSEAIVVDGHATFQVFTKDIELGLFVIGLVQWSQEHPFGSHDKGETGVRVFV